MGQITETATPSPGYRSTRAELVRAAARDPPPGRATTRPSSASTTRCRCGSRARPGRSITGRRSAASTSSTASSAARPTSGRRRSSTACGFIEPPTDAELPPDDRPGRQGDRLDPASRRRSTPDKPFFIYFAPGATHAPHHVPKDWIAKYKGQFDQGWDKLREETLRPPEGAGRRPRRRRADAAARGHPGLGRLIADERSVLARLMEVYAGFLRVRRPPDRPRDRRHRGARAASTTP